MRTLLHGNEEAAQNSVREAYNYLSFIGHQHLLSLQTDLEDQSTS